jgi:hypothetical protein
MSSPAEGRALCGLSVNERADCWNFTGILIPSRSCIVANFGADSEIIIALEINILINV